MSYIREALPGDMWLILPDVREQDKAEIAALGVDAERCMREAMAHYRPAYVLSLNSEIAGMFGVADSGEGHGIPWSVFTNAVERNQIAFLRTSRRFFDGVTEALENYVDARNVLTIKWLRWLGFTIDEPQPVGINGEIFHRFHRCATSGQSR